MLRLLQLTLGVAMNCDQRHVVITKITQELDEATMQELQAALELVQDEYLPEGDAANRSACDLSATRDAFNGCDLSATKDGFNVSGVQSFDIGHKADRDPNHTNNVTSEDDCVSKSSADEATTTDRQLAVAKRHMSPKQFVKISQSDLIELETEIACLKNNLSQAAEENKGLILMQDCHIRQISELTQQVQSRDDDIQQFKLGVTHQEILTKELVEARDKAREALGCSGLRAPARTRAVWRWLLFSACGGAGP